MGEARLVQVRLHKAQSLNPVNVRHPFEDEQGIASAIRRERAALDPLKAEADVVVDTTDLNVHQLRERVEALFGDTAGGGLQTAVMSFGYKHGLPLDVDLVLDCRFLPNPHWVEELRPHTGKDAAVGKGTFVSVLGLDGAKVRLKTLVIESEAALAPFGRDADVLKMGARFVPSWVMCVPFA